jgi:hypothetical protein
MIVGRGHTGGAWFDKGGEDSSDVSAWTTIFQKVE